MQANPQDLELYTRPKNSDGAWAFATTASSASAADEQVRFNDRLASDAQLAVVIADLDGDQVGDSADNCPAFATPNVNDADGNGIGDACECGDQNGDGFVDILDILEINEVIFGLQAASPLCDTNEDGICNILDILGANAKIFGQPAFCARFPSVLP